MCASVEQAIKRTVGVSNKDGTPGAEGDARKGNVS
jgi:hypothetical protein